MAHTFRNNNHKIYSKNESITVKNYFEFLILNSNWLILTICLMIIVTKGVCREKSERGHAQNL